MQHCLYGTGLQGEAVQILLHDVASRVAGQISRFLGRSCKIIKILISVEKDMQHPDVHWEFLFCFAGRDLKYNPMTMAYYEHVYFRENVCFDREPTRNPDPLEVIVVGVRFI